jgi:BlaI family transcriptional regulator, penicillinase repressor
MPVARPPAKELTERELEVMHVFWNTGPGTANEIRDRLATAGRELAYTTVATLIRILSDKGFVEQTNTERPFIYRPMRSFDDVSRNIVSDIVDRVFRGSREQLVLRIMEDRPLSPKERAILEAAVHLMAKQDKESAEKDQSASQRQTKPPTKGENRP